MKNNRSSRAIWYTPKYVTRVFTKTTRVKFCFRSKVTPRERNMDQKQILELYEYNRWANARILDAAAKLTADEFTKDLRNSFASIRDTLAHIMSAEWIWLMRWKGISPKQMLAPSDFPSILLLRRRWAEVEQEQAEFVASVTEESLEATISYINTRGVRWAYPLGQMMQHVVNHSTYHRGQVITMLRQLGAEPVATDLLLFQDAKSGLAV
ncbi:MAG: damage-inducible protein DinB [Acidobacteria bacterium]|nr:MAG: damage-inducible protein DinB [Acidobacteriota bacterium]